MIKEPIGFVILNYKTWEKTVTCVESIISTFPSSKQIVIVDNQSPNDSFMELSEFYSNDRYKEVTVIQTVRNGGFSYGNNYGFDFIVNNYPDISKIVITNNDILFKEKSIENLIAAFLYSENVVMTAPAVYSVNGFRTNAPWKKKPSIIQELGLRSKTDCAFKWSELTDNTPVYMVTGCCFVVDRDHFKSVGRLDENVFLYNEENIFAKKFYNAGLSIIFCPESKIIHDHGSTTGNRNVFVDKEFVKSTLYFMKQYEGLSYLQLLGVKLFYINRILLKKLTGRYDNSQFLLKYIHELIAYRIKL